jgi:hypothetical protein
MSNATISEEQFNKICDEVEHTAKGVYKVCREMRLDTTLFYKFISAAKNQGNDQPYLKYAHAKEAQCDNMADQLEELADNAEDYNKARLQVDVRKFYLSKIKPKRYGDHQQIEIISSVNSFVESTIKIIKQYVPVEVQAEVINKIQASIDFND